MAKRLKSGDVIECAAADGNIYLQYVGRHADYGDCVVVCPTVFQSRPDLTAGLFKLGYTVFYPAQVAVRRGLVTAIGNIPACRSVPVRVRRPGVELGPPVPLWIISDGNREVLKKKLSKADRQLPIASIWNHAFLLDRVTIGWRPEDE